MPWLVTACLRAISFLRLIIVWVWHGVAPTIGDDDSCRSKEGSRRTHLPKKRASSKVGNLKLWATGLFLLPLRANAIVSNPLKRPCNWEWEKPTLTEELKQCLVKKMYDEDEFFCFDCAQRFDRDVKTGGWDQASKIITVNPTGIPGLGLLKPIEVILSLFCGDETWVESALRVIPGSGIAKKVLPVLKKMLICSTNCFCTFPLPL